MLDNDQTPESIDFTNRPPQGVSAVLAINGRTRAMNKFFGNLPSGYGDPINPSNAHVTMLDYAETKIDVFSMRDLNALRDTEQQIVGYLSGLAVEREVLHPEGDELKKCGRWLAIPLRKTNFMEELRGEIGEIVRETLGVIPDRIFEPHMSAVYSVRGKSRAKEHVPPFPGNMHVNGYNVGRRAFYHNSMRTRSNQPFVNKSKAERRA